MHYATQFELDAPVDGSQCSWLLSSQFMGKRRLDGIHRGQLIPRKISKIGANR